MKHMKKAQPFDVFTSVVNEEALAQYKRRVIGITLKLNGDL